LIRQVMRGESQRTKGSLHASVRESIRLKRRFKVIGNVELTPGATPKSGPSGDVKLTDAGQGLQRTAA
jgi:hypothetical protein